MTDTLAAARATAFAWTEANEPRLSAVCRHDLPWRDYVVTARGKAWWIPTPVQGGGAGERL